jgi:hypothetical protein
MCRNLHCSCILLRCLPLCKMTAQRRICLSPTYNLQRSPTSTFPLSPPSNNYNLLETISSPLSSFLFSLDPAPSDGLCSKEVSKGKYQSVVSRRSNTYVCVVQRPKFVHPPLPVISPPNARYDTVQVSLSSRDAGCDRCMQVIDLRRLKKRKKGDKKGNRHVQRRWSCKPR